MRGEMKLPPTQATDLVVVGDSRLIQEQRHILEALVRIQKLTFVQQDPHLPHASIGHVGNLKLIMPLPEELIHAEKARLQKESTRLKESVAKIRSQLDNPSFIERAPPVLVAKQKELLAQTERELADIDSKLGDSSTLRRFADS